MAVRRVFERIIDEGRRLERLAVEGETGDDMIIVMEQTADERRCSTSSRRWWAWATTCTARPGAAHTVLGAVGVPRDADRSARRSS